MHNHICNDYKMNRDKSVRLTRSPICFLTCDASTFSFRPAYVSQLKLISSMIRSRTVCSRRAPVPSAQSQHSTERTNILLSSIHFRRHRGNLANSIICEVHIHTLRFQECHLRRVRQGNNGHRCCTCCLIRLFCGSVKMRYISCCVSGVSSTRIGSLPCAAVRK